MAYDVSGLRKYRDDREYRLTSLTMTTKGGTTYQLERADDGGWLIDPPIQSVEDGQGVPRELSRIMAMMGWK